MNLVNLILPVVFLTATVENNYVTIRINDQTTATQVTDAISKARLFDELVNPIQELREKGSKKLIREVVDVLLANLRKADRVMFTPNWESEHYFEHCIIAGELSGLHRMPKFPRKREIFGQDCFATIQDMEEAHGLWSGCLAPICLPCVSA